MERIANSRIMIDQCRLLVLHAAWTMDTVGNKAARRQIAEIKVSIPTMACQVHGLGDPDARRRAASPATSVWAKMYAGARTMRIVDGPDEVHPLPTGPAGTRRNTSPPDLNLAAE